VHTGPRLERAGLLAVAMAPIFGLSWRLVPTPGRSTTTEMLNFVSSAFGPTLLSFNNCGVLNIPPEMMTSLRAKACFLTPGFAGIVARICAIHTLSPEIFDTDSFRFSRACGVEQDFCCERLQA
jgi:hypothetical protein